MPPYVYVENEITTAKINRFTFGPRPYSWWRYGPTASDFDHDDVTPNFFEKAKSFIRNAIKNNNPRRVRNDLNLQQKVFYSNI